MAHAQLGSVLRHLRTLAGASPPADDSDARLLERFITHEDEAAFATLLQRHGPMVLAVCRRHLPCEHDAEDAFQATFVVLARKAVAIRRPDSVAGWLHGVAHRIAVKLRIAAAVRRRHEAQARPRPTDDPLQAITVRDLEMLLDAEVRRLPPRYRQPFVLWREAAQRLEADAGDPPAKPRRRRPDWSFFLAALRKPADNLALGNRHPGPGMSVMPLAKAISIVTCLFVCASPAWAVRPLYPDLEKVREYELRLKAVRVASMHDVIEMQEGQVFRLEHLMRFKIVDIIDDGEMHLDFGRGAILFSLKDFSTQGLVDGRWLDLPKDFILEVRTRKRFKTVSGATRTIFVVHAKELSGRPMGAEYARALEQAAAQEKAAAEYKRARQEQQAAAEAKKREPDLKAQLALQAKIKAQVAAEWEAAAKEKAKRDAEKPRLDGERAAARLKLIKELLQNDRYRDTAKLRLEQLIKEYPDSGAAKEAKRLLDGLNR
jgi:RNA polymerase sigma factor (sigma-70 family)